MIMRSLLCMMILCYVTYVSCNSNGLNIPCDVDYPYLGALGGTRIMDPVLQKASGRNMTWSLAPVFAGTKYTLTTETGVTTYTPNQYTTLVLRTNVQDQQFTGLLLYAVNSAGTKVGSWLIAPRQSYQIDPRSGCITHNNADPKNYKSVFRVKFPAGTGPVTIKALVKFGLAFPEARGGFFWPNNQHLQLTEGTAQPIQWFQGEPGQSCNTVCAKQNMGCDLATISNVGTAATLLATVAKTTGCFGPMMKGCGAASPAFGAEGCFYHDSTCTRDPVTFDPCSGTPAYQANAIYDPSKGAACCTYTDTTGTNKWCANFYTNSVPSATNNAWRKIVQCAPAGGYAVVGGPTRTATTIDCASVSDSFADGNRMCACSNGMPVSTATDPAFITTAPPTAPPTVPAPTNPPPTTTPAQPTPTTPTTTNAPTSKSTPTPTRSTTTTAPTCHTPTTPIPTQPTPDIIQLMNGPTTIPSSGTFSIKFQYTAVGGARTLVADILEPGNNYKYWGGGFTNVAAGTMGTAAVTITISGNPASKGGYIINYFIVDQTIYANGNNPDAWKSAIGMTMMAPVTVQAGATAPSAGAVAITTMAPPTTTTPVTETDCVNSPTTTTTATDAPVNTDPTDAPVPVTPTIPSSVNPNGSAGKNSGTQSTPTLLLAMLCMGMTGLTSRSSSMILVCALLCMSMMPSISAHNWLSSPARANDGGQGQFNGYTNPSCPPKTGRTHVQVAAGQRFPVEWATGHGFNMNSFTYLVLIKAQDEASLDIISKDSQQAINTYLTGGSNTYMPDEKVIHITPNGPAEGGRYYLDYANSAATTSLLKPIRQNPWPQGGAVFKQVGAGVTFYNKTAVGMAKDMRVQYFNPKYPYIISAHKFMVSDDRPDDMDWVMMEIPKGFPAGQYVLQYQWSGYYDCVDINVLDLPVVADIWGQKGPGTNVYAKFHHTSYTPYLQGYSATVSGGSKGCMEVTDSTTGNLLSDCQAMCNNANNLVVAGNNQVKCDAITVAPAQLNTAIVKFPGLQKDGTSHLPASCDSVLTTLKNPIATAQVCFIQKSGLPPTVGPATKTVLDPEDPTFYYTTYKQQGNWVFQQACATCNPPQPPSDFRFADQCISCADMQRNFFSSLTPRWNIASTCQHCDNRLG